MLRAASIINGLHVPDAEAYNLFSFCCKEQTRPGLHELELASRPHRNKRVRDIQARLFDAFMAEVTETEIKVFNILDLPGIDTVRASLTAAEKGINDPFEFTANQSAQIGTAFAEWLEDVAGSNESPYQYFMKSSYSVGLDETGKRILSQLDPIIADAVRQNVVFASFDDEYLKAVIRDGTKRIKVKLLDDSITKAKAQLKLMAKGEKTVMEVAAWLHENTFEGQAWYWNRLARSEGVLALERAYDRQSDALGANFDEWSAAPNACEICLPMHGRVWRRGEGPMPVSNTHPHCLCLRIPLMQHTGPVQRAWTRETPYDRPYQPGDVQRELGLPVPVK